MPHLTADNADQALKVAGATEPVRVYGHKAPLQPLVLKQHQEVGAAYIVATEMARNVGMSVEVPGDVPYKSADVYPRTILLAAEAGSGKSLMVIHAVFCASNITTATSEAGLADADAEAKLKFPKGDDMKLLRGKPGVYYHGYVPCRAVNVTWIVVPHTVIDQWREAINLYKATYVKPNKKRFIVKVVTDTQTMLEDDAIDALEREGVDVLLVTAQVFKEYYKNPKPPVVMWRRFVMDEIDTLQLGAVRNFHAATTILITASAIKLSSKYTTQASKRMWETTMPPAAHEILHVTVDPAWVRAQMELPDCVVEQVSVKRDIVHKALMERNTPSAISALDSVDRTIPPSAWLNACDLGHVYARMREVHPEFVERFKIARVPRDMPRDDFLGAAYRFACVQLLHAVDTADFDPDNAEAAQDAIRDIKDAIARIRLAMPMSRLPIRDLILEFARPKAIALRKLIAQAPEDAKIVVVASNGSIIKAVDTLLRQDKIGAPRANAAIRRAMDAAHANVDEEQIRAEMKAAAESALAAKAAAKSPDVAAPADDPDDEDAEDTEDADDKGGPSVGKKRKRDAGKAADDDGTNRVSSWVCEELKANFRLMRGNANVIASSIREFASDECRSVLYLVYKSGGAAGMNLHMATHLVTLNSMTKAEMDQAVGRSHRYPRTDALKVTHIRFSQEPLIHTTLTEN
jgi:hypothetical protein